MHKLAATTFVQAVESPTLAIVVPLLLRGLRERVTAVRRKVRWVLSLIFFLSRSRSVKEKRRKKAHSLEFSLSLSLSLKKKKNQTTQAAVITDNMAKLVDNPLDAAVFLPRLLPDLEKMAKEISDPEARSVAERARETLIRVGADGKEAASLARYPPADRATTEKALLKALAAAGVSGEPCKTVVDYAVAAALALSDAKVFEVEEWACLGPLLESLFSGATDAKDKAAGVAKAFVRACEVAAEDKAEEDDDDVGVDLCNCEFSLAYGGKILLNNARLRLKRGSRYGLCGANGCGKSTLMRAIANGQLEGFPPASELRTVRICFWRFIEFPPPSSSGRSEKKL